MTSPMERARQRITDGSAVEVVQEPIGGTVRAPKRRISDTLAFGRAVLDAHNRTYKRDADGQFAGGGVRESLANAKTIEQISAVVASEASSLTGHPVTVDFKGLDPKVARAYGEGLLTAVQRCPGSRLGQVGTYGPGGSNPEARGDPAALANTNHGPVTRNQDKIMFNAQAGSYDVSLRGKLAQASDRGEIVGRDLSYVAIHEYGHVVAGAGHAEGKVNAMAAEAAAKAGTSVQAYVERHVSSYAASDHVELSAEVFADVLIHGSGASSFSKDAFREIETEFGASGPARDV